jgi:hypothetical protein
MVRIQLFYYDDGGPRLLIKKVCHTVPGSASHTDLTHSSSLDSSAQNLTDDVQEVQVDNFSSHLTKLCLQFCIIYIKYNILLHQLRQASMREVEPHIEMFNRFFFCEV